MRSRGLVRWHDLWHDLWVSPQKAQELEGRYIENRRNERENVRRCRRDEALRQTLAVVLSP